MKGFLPLSVVNALILICLAISAAAKESDNVVYSGPQVGETLASFRARGVFDDFAAKEFDMVAQADGKSLVIIFVHEITRPSIGLTRMVMNYAATRAKDGLKAGIVFLADDTTEMEAALKRARHALPEQVPIGISTDGKEGPGAYGLNRNVTLTVLIAKDNQVTANFALVQPSIQTDAAKIAQAIVDVLGGGPLPKLEQFGADRMSAGVDLRALLAPLIQKTASPQDVDRAAAAIEAVMARNEFSRRQVAQAAGRIVESGNLQNYGTPAAQSYLRKWAEMP